MCQTNFAVGFIWLKYQIDNKNLGRAKEIYQLT